MHPGDQRGWRRHRRSRSDGRKQAGASAKLRSGDAKESKPRDLEWPQDPEVALSAQRATPLPFLMKGETDWSMMLEGMVV